MSRSSRRLGIMLAIEATAFIAAFIVVFIIGVIVGAECGYQARAEEVRSCVAKVKRLTEDGL